jgi:hypothetical protein
VGLEPTIPASERAKTVHGLDRSATVTGIPNVYFFDNKTEYEWDNKYQKQPIKSFILQLLSLL